MTWACTHTAAFKARNLTIEPSAYNIDLDKHLLLQQVRSHDFVRAPENFHVSAEIYLKRKAVRQKIWIP